MTKLDSDMVGRKSHVAVLGTIHLGETREAFKPQSLDNLLNKLAAYKPDTITVEKISGEECDLIARFAEKYKNVSDFCPNPAVARAATGLDAPAASTQLNKALKELPAQPSAAQRRRLVALFLAANESASAYAQWLQLPEIERREGDGLDESLIKLLASIAKSKSEVFLIAAPLAARLGLQRVYQVDNHTGDNPDVQDEETFGKEISTAWKAGRAEMKELDEKRESLTNADDLLPLYRLINLPSYQRANVDLNVRSQLRAKSTVGYPQMWVAGWEIRNLRMVANIRESFRERPGARVLSIVGASHKPWFDSWLGQFQGVEIVDIEEVLK
ncbi:DUF5694 domain-containing protein [Roseateles sp. NT4]|uniref:DUF5694 domain-containing protein n=1 Tax=Roseateles sp. NT4 TaxID=3453715 RepID=UPI003EEB74DD